MLNTTWSETGLRVGFSPFPLHEHSDGTMFNFEEIARSTAPTGVAALIHAAVGERAISGDRSCLAVSSPSRPAGRPQRWNFVDGGYVDNSGATSALEIYQQLAHYLPAPPGAHPRRAAQYPPLFEIDLRLCC